MSYALRMSDEIRTWLTDLRASDPPMAMLVGQTLTALIEQGADLGPPLVTGLSGPLPPQQLSEALERAYAARLDRLHEVRRRAADASAAGAAPSPIAELEELQSEADAFRMRKEVLRARYVAAQTHLAIDENDIAAAEGLAEVIALMERELGSDAMADGLLELRAGAPERGDVLMFFAVEPAGAALVISVLEGPAAIGEHRDRAMALSAEVLRAVRAGRDPEASAHVFSGKAAFLAEFFPDSADEVEAGAAALIARDGPRAGAD